MQEPGAYLNDIQLSYTIPEPTRAMTDAPDVDHVSVIHPRGCRHRLCELV